MKLRKRFILPLAVFLSVFLMNLTAFGYTESHVSKYVTVRPETVLTGSDRPILYIEPSSDHTLDFYFELMLKNARWKYQPAEGTFDSSEPGVTYKVTDNSSMIVYVNVADGENDTQSGNDITFDAAAKSIEIPLYVEVLNYGEASVEINSIDSTVSSARHAFAYVPSGESLIMEYGKSNTVYAGTELDNIIINDGRSISISGNSDFTLSLSSGAKFGNIPKVTGSGKFLSNVKFVKDSRDASKAYIDILNTTDAQPGTIVLEGIELLFDKNTFYGPIELTLEFKGNKQTVTVANYQKTQTQDTPIVISEIKTDGKRPVFSGTAARNYRVVLYIDGNWHKDFTVGSNSAWSVEYRNDIPELSEGIHEATVGYYTDSGKKIKGEVKKEFTINDPSNDIRIKIGEGAYYIGSKAYGYSDLAYIKNGRTMLPLRLVSNILGIPNSSIAWNDSLKEASITKADGTVMKILAGADFMTVDGKRTALDAPAEIKDDRVFLPMRALLNALGVSDDLIVWEDNTVKVTVIKQW